jgi:hypothetical protein
MFEELVCKVHLLLCICNNTQWSGWQYIVFHKLGVQFSTNLTNIINFFSIFSARPFVSYFVPSISCSYGTEDSKSAKGPYCRQYKSTTICFLFSWLPICPMNMCLVVPTHVCVHVMHVSGLVSITSPKPSITGGSKVCLGSMHLFLLGPRADRKKEGQAVFLCNVCITIRTLC